MAKARRKRQNGDMENVQPRRLFTKRSRIDTCVNDGDDGDDGDDGGEWHDENGDPNVQDNADEQKECEEYQDYQCDGGDDDDDEDYEPPPPSPSPARPSQQHVAWSTVDGEMFFWRAHREYLYPSYIFLARGRYDVIFRLGCRFVTLPLKRLKLSFGHHSHIL